MKFIHTADWHLGKIVHGIHMTENQRHMLQDFLRIVEEEKPDAVVIAGDLYDRSVPPTEAVELLDDILFKINIGLKTPVIAITGNHDSAERLSFGTSWYKHSQLHIQSKVDPETNPIRINGVNFYCVPYAEPGIVRQVLEDETIHTHEQAMAALIGKMESNLNVTEPNVFIGHAFVTGGAMCDSERLLTVGGSGTVSSSLFEPFAYTALGHLHSPDAIKHPTVHYSGSLLKYSFSEANHNKSVNIVDVAEDGTLTVKKRSLKPKRDLREVTGYFDEIMDPAFIRNQNTDDYLNIILLDEGSILDPVQRLKQVYPNILHLERKWDATDQKRKQSYAAQKGENKSELDLFKIFYSEMTDRVFDEEKQQIMKRIIESAKKEAEQ
ncbi:MAG: exonuclease SbcCD subunit D [Bacillus sp. (in: firmicutes)]